MGVKQSGARLPNAIAAFVSPSGDGVKVVVRYSPIPKNPDDANAAAAVAVELYSAALGVEPDPDAPSAIERLCYLSFDPDIRIHAEPECWAMAYKG